MAGIELHVMAVRCNSSIPWRRQYGKCHILSDFVVDWCGVHVAVSQARDYPSGQYACSGNGSRLTSLALTGAPSLNTRMPERSVEMLCGVLLRGRGVLRPALVAAASGAAPALAGRAPRSHGRRDKRTVPGGVQDREG